jgi:hypothetical protein
VIQRKLDTGPSFDRLHAGRLCLPVANGSQGWALVRCWSVALERLLPSSSRSAGRCNTAERGTLFPSLFPHWYEMREIEPKPKRGKARKNRLSPLLVCIILDQRQLRI